MVHLQQCVDEGSPAALEANFNQEIKNLQDKLSDAVGEKEEMAQRCHVLDMQVCRKKCFVKLLQLSVVQHSSFVRSLKVCFHSLLAICTL